MSLPFSLNDLLHQRTVEGARIEYKKGWNPAPIMRTLCAFANDFENLGGGYVIIGQECDDDGRPVFPPCGLAESQLDHIQQELLAYCNQIQPPYFPHLFMVKVEGQNVIVLWAPGGLNRAYKVPRDVTAKNKEYQFYVRRFSSTVQVRENSDEQRELLSLTAQIPFDDRQHQAASIDDLNRDLIYQFLHQVGSKLAEDRNVSTLELGRQLELVVGADEHVKPRNVGLLFFNDEPKRFIKGSQIDIVIFPNDLGGDEIVEKIFDGPLHRQITLALQYIQDAVIVEKVFKRDYKPQADRMFNYPLAAIEEALVNAVYHRSYELREPVEVRVRPHRIEILSYPGPDRSIRDTDLVNGQMLARRYRNRRIGELLKELDMTEGRGTGIPKIKKMMAFNGSPPATFSTDEDRTHFLTILPIHEQFEDERGRLPDSPITLSELESGVLELLKSGETSRGELAESLGTSPRSGTLKRAIERLLELGLVEFTLPNTPRSPHQKLRLPES